MNMRFDMKHAVTVIAVAMSLFHLYVAWFGPPNAFTLRATHFGFALALAFLSLPMTSKGKINTPGPLDLLFLVGALAAAAYPVINLGYFNTRMAYVGPVWGWIRASPF